MDEWLPILNNEDYLISDKGQVYSVKKRRLLKTKSNTVKINFKSYSLCRLVCKHFYKNWNQAYKVIHIDENINNNCIENLKMVATNDLNWKQVNNDEGIGKWVKADMYRYSSYIIIKGKRHDLGFFDTEEEAIEAYNDMAQHYHVDCYKIASV